MAQAKCFRCLNIYDSYDPDDIAGDGKCLSCKEFSKKIALEVDIKMAEIRRVHPLPQRNPLLDHEGPINARELGLKNWGN